MLFHHEAAVVEADAEAPDILHVAGGDAVVFLEDAAALGGGDADAVVLHLDADAAVGGCTPEADGDFGGGGGIFDRIVQDVGDGGGEVEGVGGDGGGGTFGVVLRDAGAASGADGQFGAEAVEHCPKVAGGGVQCQVVPFLEGDVKDAADHCGECSELVADDLQVAAAAFGVLVGGIVEQGLAGC